MEKSIFISVIDAFEIQRTIKSENNNIDFNDSKDVINKFNNAVEDYLDTNIELNGDLELVMNLDELEVFNNFIETLDSISKQKLSTYEKRIKHFEANKETIEPSNYKKGLNLLKEKAAEDIEKIKVYNYIKEDISHIFEDAKSLVLLKEEKPQE